MGLERCRSAGYDLELDPRHAHACCFHRRTPHMNRKCLLEISVETLEAALAAERGGADRIELCGGLPLGGVPTGTDLVRTVRARVGIPVFAMIRPRAGDFFYSITEFAAMKRSAIGAKESAM